ncbi:MAG TPA: L-2-amino-thiazoline-4-carboxylic acid hydrolase [Anaerolineales bacterium]|nr:L-2-amino-thiazoline-4-carboxylic acid hydrolase [Anaerolineales bacterium]
MTAKAQIERAIRFAAPVVASHFDKQKAQTILEAMRKNYQAIDPEVPILKSPFNQMTLKIAVDALAFYRALLTKVPQAETLVLIQPFVDNWMDGQFDHWIARTVYANRALHILYRRRWFAMTNRADEPDGQKFEFLPPTGDLFYGVNVVRCGMVKFLAQMGAPEIGPFLCRGDFHIQGYLPKGIVFQRTRVIAEGGSYCDFRYYAATRSKK